MVSVLGQNIKELRELQGLSGNKLASLANVGSSTISQIENGVRQTLKVETLAKIAKALDTNTHYLLLPKSERRNSDIVTSFPKLHVKSFLTLDGVLLTEKELEKLQYSIDLTLNAIRYERSK